MKRTLKSYFKTTSKDVRTLSFGTGGSSFNYVEFNKNNSLLNNTASLFKEMNDSYVLEIGMADNYAGTIPKLKLTNQNILTWEDYWVDGSTKNLVDPLIEHVNLQKNQLVHANFNLKRAALKSVNLEGNRSLRAVFVHSAPKLEVLNISNCQGLDVINLGENRAMKALLAKNCQMSSLAMEKMLRDFRPVYTSTSNEEFRLFRKNYETVLDLRGSVIDWGNRRIASKIRLLLCNNWLVLWDNSPPTSIVPPQMYSFFTTNLEDSLIKEYYGTL